MVVMAAVPSGYNRIAPAILGLGAAWAYALMSYMVKQTSHGMPSSEIVAVRGAFGLIVCCLIWGKNSSHRESLRLSYPLGVRSLCAAVSVLCLFYNISQSHVSTAIAYTNLTPALVTIMSRFLKLEPLRMTAIGGVTLIAAGGTLLNSGGDWAPRADVTLIGILGALMSAASLVTLKASSQRHSPLAILIWFHLSLLIAASISGAGKWTIPSKTVLLPLLLASAFALVGQGLLIASIRRGTASLGTALTWTDLIWVATLEYGFLGYVPPIPKLLSFGTMLLGVCMIQVASWQDTRHSHGAPTLAFTDPDH